LLLLPIAHCHWLATEMLFAPSQMGTFTRRRIVSLS
jgi:hypothetical protein